MAPHKNGHRVAPRKNILTHGKKQKALVSFKAGRMQEARELLASVCERDRTDTQAWLIRGAACGNLGAHAEAAQCFRTLAAIQPRNAEAFYNLGIAERALGEATAAEQSFHRAIEINPEYPEALESLAHILLSRGALVAGAEALRAALALRPDNTEWRVNLGAILQAQGHLSEAIANYEQARSLRPGTLIASENLGSALASQGRTKEALAVYREGLQQNLKDARVHSNLLLSLNYLPNQDPMQIFAEHRRWGELHGRLGTDSGAFADTLDPDRRLRIGYVSPDFRTHSVAYFIEPILAAHDRAAFEVFCYADVPRPDTTTERLKCFSDHWRPISGLSDAEVLKQIRADRIDILVDLAGHTSGHRLSVFAQRAAPMQVTYLGYPNTTGLTTMDYRITDTVADPEDQDAYYTEKLIRLDNCFLCYQPPIDAPAVNSLPAEGAGHITFGSFNNLAKIQPDVIDLWAGLLRALPTSHLLIKNPSLTDPTARELLLAAFAEHGIAQDQIELLGLAQTQAEHLGLYGRVDIALDTFPYNGTTTTCEALWMGVPVATLAGDRHAGRVGATLLHAAGLEDLITDSPQNYIARVIELATDMRALEQLRAGLRERVRQSALCNATSPTRALEAELRSLWQNRHA